MENVLPVLLLMIFGVVLKRLPVFPASTGQSLNMFVVYVSLPALILLQVPRLKISTDLWAPIILPWLMLLISALLVLALSKSFNWSKGVTGGLLMVATLGNTSFLGVPFTQAFFGDSGVPYAVLYDQGTFFALTLYGTVVLSLYGEAGGANWRKILFKIVSFPPFIAMVLAFSLRGVAYPPAIMGLLEKVAGTLVPIVMVAIGFQLSFKVPRAQLGPMGMGILIKMGVAPGIALLGVKILGIDNEATRVAILESGMAPMITAGALAISANLAPQMIAAMLGLGIMLAFISLPILFSLI